jgi:hypothetical protein
MSSARTPSTAAIAERASPMPHQRPRPARLALRSIGVKNPPQTLIISLIASGGFLAIQRSAAFCVSHSSGNSRVSCLGVSGSAEAFTSFSSAAAVDNNMEAVVD